MIYKNLKELNQNLPKEGRIMALDVGTQTIGVAISDISRLIATPKLTIKRKGNKKDFPVIEKLIKENKIKALIIGLPLNMDGSETNMSDFVNRFADNLNQFLEDIKITFCDERLTSFTAETVINEIEVRGKRKKEIIDQIAASIILQSALDEIRVS